MGIDIENGFIPKYEVSEDKKACCCRIKEECENYETVWIATDEDEEAVC